MKDTLARSMRLTATALLLAGMGLMDVSPATIAQPILEEQGRLIHAQTHQITLETDRTFTILASSDEFDTVLTVLAPDGEEVAFNDDFGIDSNSVVVLSVPTTGEYTVLVTSYRYQGGGAYQLMMRPATSFDIAFDAARTQSQSQNYRGAIDAYTEAIRLQPDNPVPYLGRADAYVGEAAEQLQSQGSQLESLSDLSRQVREAIVADYQRAADLFDAVGDTIRAQSLRDQIDFINTGEAPTFPVEGVR